MPPKKTTGENMPNDEQEKTADSPAPKLDKGPKIGEQGEFQPAVYPLDGDIIRRDY